MSGGEGSEGEMQKREWQTRVSSLEGGRDGGREGGRGGEASVESDAPTQEDHHRISEGEGKHDRQPSEGGGEGGREVLENVGCGGVAVVQVAGEAHQQV